MSSNEPVNHHHQLPLEALPTGCFILTKEGCIAGVNAAGAALLGAEKSALVNVPFERFVAPRHRDAFLSFTERLFATLQPQARELTLAREDGGETVVQCNGSVIENREPVQWVLSVNDITDCARTKEALRQYEENFRRIFDQAPIGMAMVGFDHRFERVNEAFCRITGYSPQELAALRFPDITYPDDRDTNVEHAHRLISGAIDRYETEKRYLRKDGTVVWVRLVSKLTRDEARKAPYFLTMVEDITGRKHAEKAIRDRLAFEKIIASVSTNFINLTIDRIDEGIGNALRLVGEFTGADRCNIFLFSKDMKKMSNVYEWCREGVPSAMAQLQNVSLEPFPWFRWKICKPEIIHIPRVSELPAEAAAEKEDLQRGGLKSLLDIPMVYQGEVLGYVGFSATHEERIWSEDSINLLKITGEIFTNALERKWTEEALKRSEEKYHTLFETMAQGVVYQDAGGNIVSANPSAEKILGLSLNEMKGRTSFDPRWRTVREDGADLPGENHPSMMALRTGKEVRNVILGIFNPGREEYRWIIVNAVPQFRPGEEIPYQVFMTFEDVTERKRAQELLQVSELRYRELVENMSSGVIVYRANDEGTDFAIVDFNHAGERIEKVKKEEIINKSVLDVFPGVREFGLFSVLRRVWETGTPEHFPVSFYKDNRISGWRENYVYRLPSGEVVAVYDDVTERKTAEEALRESEKRYRGIFENAVVGMFATTLDGKIIAVNPATARMTGYESPEELKHQVTDLARQLYVHREDRARFIELIQQSGGKPVTFETWVRRKDGSSYLGRLDAWLVRDREGKITHLEGFVEDITERRKAEETLRENEARFRAVVQTSSDGIVIFDQAGKVLFVNEAEARINGYPRPEDMVRDLSYFAEVYELRYPDGRLLPVDEWPVSKVLRGESVREWELRGRRKDTGREWFFSFSGEPVFDSHNRLILAVTFTRDITARKEAEDALRESENRYRTIFENTGTATLILEDDMTISLVNGEFEKLSGFAKEDIEHKKKWGEFVARDDLAMTTDYHHRRRVHPEAIPEKYELKFVDRAGNVKKVIVTADLIPGTKRSVLSLQDITALKLTEEQLVKSREVAEKRAHETEEGKRILETLMDQIPEGIVIVDAPGGLVRMISKYGQEMVGPLTEGLEMGRHPYWQLLHTDGVTPAADEEYPLVRAARYGEVITNEEWIMRNIDGKNIAVLVNAGPIKDAGGRLAGGVATWRDITERKQEQEKLRYSYEKLQRSIDGIVSAIVKIVETRDPYTAGHEKRVSQLASAIAREMGLSEEKVSGIRMAAIIHDIGKIYVPSEILSKPGTLSEMEFAIIKIHPQASYDILKVIDFPWPVAQIALQHQERLDGSGYPLGLKGDNILLEARILSVADVVEAMMFSRPYRAALGIEKALEEIEKNKGILYDPDVADACLKLFRENRFTFGE